MAKIYQFKNKPYRTMLTTERPVLAWLEWDLEVHYWLYPTSQPETTELLLAEQDVQTCKSLVGTEPLLTEQQGQLFYAGIRIQPANMVTVAGEFRTFFQPSNALPDLYTPKRINSPC